MALAAAVAMLAALVAVASPAAGHLQSSDRDQLIAQDSPGIEGVGEANDDLGFSVAWGDFDNDGFADLAAGAPGESIGAVSRAGAVNVVYGASDGLSTRDEIWHQDIADVEGVAEANDNFGRSLAVGNFNGDAFDDLAIGVPFEDGAAPPNDGAVNVLFGSATGLTATGDQFFSQSTAGFPTASEAEDQIGFTLSSGDYNGDGRDDVAIGAPSEDVSAAADAGAVVILYGQPAGLSTSGATVIEDDGAGVFGGPEAGDDFGAAIASGDFDGDDIDDLAISAVDEDHLGVETGAVTIWPGRAGVGPDGTTSSAGFSLSTLGAAAADSDDFGEGLAAGDYNGDGIHDLAIGAPDADTDAQIDGGSIHVLYGVDTTGLSAAGAVAFDLASPGMASTPNGSDGLGRALAAGEFDGDDIDDLVAAFDPSRTLVMHGSSDGLGTARSHVIVQRARSIGAGDADGDGIDDVALGDDNADVGGINDAGQVFVRYGTVTATCGGLLATVDLSLGQVPTDGDDVIVGTDGDDEILALGGDDTVCAGDGDDSVRGGPGADTIRGEQGRDDLRGNSGRDTIRGGKHADAIRGGKAADRLIGGGGPDDIGGNGGPDDIRGNAKSDDLAGGKGNDDIRGGPGSDSIDGGPGTDTCTGGPGVDTVVSC